MTKHVQDTAPPRSDAVKKWLKQNIGEQKKRHAAIMKEINVNLAPKRVKWYKEFLKNVSTTGFNFNGDMKRIIAKKDLPKPPKRKDQVVY
ncbi:MAG: hypothetical protein E2O52_08395 [Gammaproteobacteria bacterium]|nr:MAG: hypothetical protein E2O52_08395 [Gammaproteobacteria bacterium]